MRNAPFAGYRARVVNSLREVRARIIAGCWPHRAALGQASNGKVGHIGQPLVNGLQIPKLVQQLGRPLGPHTPHAGNIVRGVANQRLQIGHLAGVAIWAVPFRRVSETAS